MIARVGASRVTFDTVRGFTIAEPAGCADDDTLLLATATDAAHSTSGTPPTGWTKIGQVNAGSNDTTLSVFWKRRIGAESATWTNIFAANAAGISVLAAYRGCEPATPLDVAPVFSTISFDDVWPTALITPLTANAKLVGIFGNDPNAAYTFTWDAPTTDFVDSDTTPSGLFAGTGYIVIGDRDLATPAATRVQGTVSDTDQAAACIVALRPASAAPAVAAPSVIAT